jgi:hypothetical protein
MDVYGDEKDPDPFLGMVWAFHFEEVSSEVRRSRRKILCAEIWPDFSSSRQTSKLFKPIDHPHTVILSQTKTSMKPACLIQNLVHLFTRPKVCRLACARSKSPEPRLPTSKWILSFQCVMSLFSLGLLVFQGVKSNERVLGVFFE